MSEWQRTTWGDVATLEYGKAIRDYQDATGPYRVYGTNGPIGWHTEPLSKEPSVIVGRKGAYRGIHYSDKPFFVIDTAFYLKPKIKIDTRWAYYCLYVVRVFWTRSVKTLGVFLARWFQFKLPFSPGTTSFASS